MALIKCQKCANEFSDDLNICPHCGNPTHTSENSNTDRDQKLMHIKKLLESTFSTNEGFNGESQLRELDNTISSVVSGTSNEIIIKSLSVFTRYFVEQIDSNEVLDRKIMDLKIENIKLVFDFHRPLVVACFCNLVGFGVFNVAAKITDKNKFVNLVNTRFHYVRDMLKKIPEMKAIFGIALKNNIDLANDQRIWIENFKLNDKDKCSPFRYSNQYIYVDHCFNANIRELNKEFGYEVPLIYMKN